MLHSCSRCGRIHEKGKCPQKRERTTTERTPSQRFRGSARWQHLTRTIRDRDNDLCQACIHENPARYTGDPLEVHHIVPINEDWTLRADPDNGITLCPNHHELAEAGMIERETLRAWVQEANEQQRKRSGWIAI